MKQAITLAVLVMAIAAPRAPAQTTLRYKFKEGDKLQYVLDQDMMTTVSLKGKETDTRLHIIWDLQWNVLKVDDAGAASVQIKINRARMFVEGPLGKAAADSADKNEPEDDLHKSLTATVKIMAAMELRGTMLPTGAMNNVKATDDSFKAVKELGGAKNEKDLLDSDFARSMQFATVFPSEPLTNGKSWTKKIDTKADFGKMAIENTFTYAGPVEKDRLKLEKASINVGVKIQPDEKAPLKGELKGVKSDGHVLFDNRAGRLVEAVVNQRTDMVMEVKGTRFNRTIEQSLTIRLKGK